MAKEELLCRNRTGRVDHDLLPRSMSFSNEEANVGKKRSPDLSSLVTMFPEVTLESFQIGGLDIAGHEMADVLLKSGARVAILFGKGVPILTEAGTVPLLVENLGKRGEGVRELAGTGPRSVMAVGSGIGQAWAMDDISRVSQQQVPVSVTVGLGAELPPLGADFRFHRCHSPRRP